MLEDLRRQFNGSYEVNQYQQLLDELDARVGSHVEFRVAETPVFLSRKLLQNIESAGAQMALDLIDSPTYLNQARAMIPQAFRVPRETAHPNFLTADFALVSDKDGSLTPRLVEIQAFPSVFAYQSALNSVYRKVYGLSEDLGVYLGGLDETGFWSLLAETVLGRHAPENVVLTEVDPFHQKTLPDFLATAKKLGISIVDIEMIEPIGNKLHYRNGGGTLTPIHRIYNRAIADEMIARKIKPGFDITLEWDVEWAGHPNWYFLISKFSVPTLSRNATTSGSAYNQLIPPAVFLDDFLVREGAQELKTAGVPLPLGDDPALIYDNLLLKPLFSFAGHGIQFGPARRDLEAIPVSEQKNYLLQQRMNFVPNIETPFGPTQAEIRILYLWPDHGSLTPALPLIRLGRGKMMGVDHNRNQQWVGGSAAFWR